MMSKSRPFFSLCAAITATAFAVVGCASVAGAQTSAPASPAAVVSSSLILSELSPSVHLKGIVLDPQDPLSVQFVLHVPQGEVDQTALQNASQRFADYFLAALAIPEKDLWVNLSPYEPKRMASEKLAHTIMGVDLLEEDYKLKTLVSRLMDPETPIGQAFWQRAQSLQSDKVSESDLKSLQKVWIVPQTAVVYESSSGAFVAESSMGVMLEGEHQSFVGQEETSKVSDAVLQALKEIIIPEVEREVSNGETFWRLRQIYQAMILATWFKKNLAQNPLSDVYVNRGRTQGVENGGEQELNRVYRDYLAAFQRGSEGVIAQEYDPLSGDIQAKVYQTGGADMAMLGEVFKNASDDKEGLLESLSSGTVYLSKMNFSLVFLIDVDPSVRGILLVILIVGSLMFASYIYTGYLKSKERKNRNKNNAMLAQNQLTNQVTFESSSGIIPQDPALNPGGVDFNADLFKRFDVQKQGEGIHIANNGDLLKLKNSLGGLRPVFVNAELVQDIQGLLGLNSASKSGY